MNVHSLSNLRSGLDLFCGSAKRVSYRLRNAVSWSAPCRPERAGCSRCNQCAQNRSPHPLSVLSCERGLAARPRRHLAGQPPQRSGFPLRHCLHRVRYYRDRLRCRVEPSERIRGWLPDELEDRRSHAQNAGGINRRFHRAPPFLFRVSQDSVY